MSKPAIAMHKGLKKLPLIITLWFLYQLRTRHSMSYVFSFWHGGFLAEKWRHKIGKQAIFNNVRPN